MTTKRVFWAMVVVGALAAITPGMTVRGFLWLLALVPVVMLVVRLCWWMVVEDARETERIRRRSGVVVERGAAIPHGWTMEDYVVDGLRCLQIHLIQSARRSSS